MYRRRPKAAGARRGKSWLPLEWIDDSCAHRWKFSLLFSLLFGVPAIFFLGLSNLIGYPFVFFWLASFASSSSTIFIFFYIPPLLQRHHLTVTAIEEEADSTSGPPSVCLCVCVCALTTFSHLFSSVYRDEIDVSFPQTLPSVHTEKSISSS